MYNVSSLFFPNITVKKDSRFYSIITMISAKNSLLFIAFRCIGFYTNYSIVYKLAKWSCDNVKQIWHNLGNNKSWGSMMISVGIKLKQTAFVYCILVTSLCKTMIISAV